MTADTRIELYSPEFFADPYPYYRQLRTSEPVYWHPKYQIWILTRYEDVRRVACQPEIYSSRLSALDTRPPSVAVRPTDLPLLQEIDEVHIHEFIQMDPPQHTVKRVCVSPRFGPKTLEGMRTTIREIIASLLDQVAESTNVELLSTVARPLPLLVVSRIMGIPAEDVGLIAAQATKRMTAVLSLDEDRLPVSLEGFRATSDYLTHSMDQRLGALGNCPVQNDVLADMALAEDRAVYTRPETLANAMMIIDAGHETTIQLICNGTLMLLQRPDQWQKLVADPRRRTVGATDECLRFDPPLHVLRRVATADVEVGGQQIRTGDRVLAVVASANRDPERFPEPDRFDIERRPNAHLSFGVGAHFCLGQYLARLEGQEYFAALAERFPNARVLAPDEVTYNPTPDVRSVTALPISLT